MDITTLAEYGDLCGEGPIWDVRKDCLYWTDALGDRFYRYDWAAKKPEVVNEGFQIFGCALNADGNFVITNQGGVWLWDGSGSPRQVAGEVEGSKCRLNDCIADPQGRLLTGSVFYDAEKEYPLGKLICIDTDGSASILDEGIHLSNGLGFSPDRKTLYFTDSIARSIFAYDYDEARGTAKNRRVFVQVPDNEGIPDGLTVDANGFVWSAQWYGSCVVRYDPSGKLERRVEIPAKQTSSLAFGGPDLSDVFVTSARKSEPMPLMPPGYDWQAGYFGGALFHFNMKIKGKPEFNTRISLKA